MKITKRKIIASKDVNASTGSERRDYFVETYAAYQEFVRDDAYNWLAAGYQPGEVTVESLRDEYSGVIEFMTNSEAEEIADEYHNVYSIDQMCEDINNAIQGWQDESSVEGAVNAATGYGYTQNGDEIDESTVDELYRIACETLDNSVLGSFCSIDEDSFEYTATGTAFGAYLQYAIFGEFHYDALLDLGINLNQYILPSCDRILLDMNDTNNDIVPSITIYINGESVNAELSDVDAYQGNTHSDYMSATYRSCIDWDAVLRDVVVAANPVISEIHQILSNI